MQKGKTSNIKIPKQKCGRVKLSFACTLNTVFSFDIFLFDIFLLFRQFGQVLPWESAQNEMLFRSVKTAQTVAFSTFEVLSINIVIDLIIQGNELG